jgi:hypothetical protein
MAINQLSMKSFLIEIIANQLHMYHVHIKQYGCIPVVVPVIMGGIVSGKSAK